MPSKKLYTEYEAACITGMSPELLRWLTSYAPKWGANRKLRFEKIERETYFFEKGELLAFDRWLKMPWPRKDGCRPHIPSGIRREVINEANGECAICHGHKDTCEAAHLDPVHKSFNNHPENLLWLCSNHHKAYDGGLFGPSEENAEFVVSFKRVLRRYNLTRWHTQHEISQKLLTVLENCDGLARQLEMAKTSDQVKAVEQIAKATLEKLPVLATVSKDDPNFDAYESLVADFKALSREAAGDIGMRLERAHDLRQQYVAAFGFVLCPLCKGSGKVEGSDCPVCEGDREVDERIADRIDVSAFDKVDCPLCEGAGRFEGDDCPACGGDAQMERRHAESVDVSDYKKVSCPLCEGARTKSGRDCPVCRGDGELDRRYANNVDVREYQEVDCPLCEGQGRYDGDDCPECHGERTMERRAADLVHLADYVKLDCPVCDGKGRRNGDDCPVCDGEARLERRHLDMIDIRDYEMVKCPECKGQRWCDGDECSACNGEGELERRYVDRS